MDKADIDRACRLLDWIESALGAHIAREDEWLVELLVRDLRWLHGRLLETERKPSDDV